MRRAFAAALAGVLLASANLCAADDAPIQTVDLREPYAFQRLHEEKPGHYEVLERMSRKLTEEPRRAEGDWLKTHFNVRDVDLSKDLIKTSNPPMQVLSFTLDDVRYVMNVIRSDLASAEPKAAK